MGFPGVFLPLIRSAEQNRLFLDGRETARHVRNQKDFPERMVAPVPIPRYPQCGRHAIEEEVGSLRAYGAGLAKPGPGLTVSRVAAGIEITRLA
jgi:hypothetical protein